MGDTLEYLESENIYDDCEHFTQDCYDANCIECSYYVGTGPLEEEFVMFSEIEEALNMVGFTDDAIDRIKEFVKKEMHING